MLRNNTSSKKQTQIKFFTPWCVSVVRYNFENLQEDRLPHCHAHARGRSSKMRHGPCKVPWKHAAGGLAVS